VLALFEQLCETFWINLFQEFGRQLCKVIEPLMVVHSSLKHLGLQVTAIKALREILINYNYTQTKVSDDLEILVEE